ncbi:MAG: heptosyltransferase-2 [Halieaceae bacterium]|jgi:heptosyltransferase-2
MTVETVLVVGPSWVGDMVMAQSLFKALLQRNPDSKIDVLAPAWSLPILALMPEVRQQITMPVGHGKLALGTRYRLAQKLAGTGYDQAIVVPNSLKSSLIPAFARIPIRTGWLGEVRYGLLNDHRKLDKQKFPLMVQRLVALAGPEGAALPEPLPEPELCAKVESVAATARSFLDWEDGDTEKRPLLALCPGAEFGAAKQWPPQHYARVASHYLQLGWHVVLLGSGNDVDCCNELLAEVDNLAGGTCRNLAGQTNMEEVVNLLSLASLVVSNDSGLMHIAAALLRPTIAVYGATSPDFTPPLAASATIVRNDIDCSPCFARECPLGHHRCMKELAPDRVIAAANQLLSQPLRGI